MRQTREPGTMKRRTARLLILALLFLLGATFARAQEEKPTPPPTLTCLVQEGRLADTLRLLLIEIPEARGGKRIFYKIAPNLEVASVTFKVVEKTLPETLDALCGGSYPKLTWRCTDQGVYEFTRLVEPSETSKVGRKVQINARNVEVKRVLMDLFRQAGTTQYSIADNVTSYITLRVQDRPFEEALGILARTARPPLKVTRTTAGIWEIRTRTFGNQ